MRLPTPPFLRRLQRLFAAFGSVVGKRHFKAVTRYLAAFAALVNGYVRQFGEQGLSYAAHLGVVRRHGGQRAAVPPIGEPTITAAALDWLATGEPGTVAVAA